MAKDKKKTDAAGRRASRFHLAVLRGYLEWRCNAVGRRVINASCRWYRVVDDPRDDR